MGKSSKKRRKNSNKNKAKIKYRSRRDFLLSEFPEAVLDIWFGDDEKKRNEFGDFLIQNDEINQYDSYGEILDSDGYEEKITELRSKKHNSMTDMYITLLKIDEVKRKKKKHKKYSKMRKKKDISLATYLDSSRYSKKYLSKSKYRKELKKIAKSERDELKEMRKLGYIKNKSVDDELKKLKKANSLMSSALSDAYTQKHFITD